jgi:hypothetical protein
MIGGPPPAADGDPSKGAVAGLASLLRLRVVMPLVAVGAGLAVVAGLRPVNLAEPPDLAVRFSLLCGLAGLAILVWGQQAVLRGPRHWARGASKRLAARYLELVVIAALALLPFVHCEIRAARVVAAWGELVQTSRLHKVTPPPYAENATEAERAETREAWKVPVLTFGTHANYLIQTAYQLVAARCPPPQASGPDPAAFAECMSEIRRSPSTSQEREYIEDVELYRRALEVLGGPKAGPLQLAGGLGIQELPQGSRVLWRINDAYERHRDALLYWGWSLLAAGVAFSFVFLAREVGTLNAFVHVGVFGLCLWAGIGLSYQITGKSRFPAALGQATLTVLVAIVIAAIAQARSMGRLWFGRSASILLVAALPLAPAALVCAAGLDIFKQPAATALGLGLWVVAIPFVHLLPPMVINVFVSYSQDRAGAGTDWLERATTALRVLEVEGLVRLFVDKHRIVAGEDWDEQISRSAKAADIAVVLVSERLLQSSYVMTRELPILLERARQKLLELRLVIVEVCAWRDTELSFPDAASGPHRVRLGAYQTFRAVTEPLATLSPATVERLFAELTSDIRDVALRRDVRVLE